MEEKKLVQGFNESSSEISEKNKKALQSETWNTVRQAMKKEDLATDETAEATVQTEPEPENSENIKEQAKKKLEDELKKAKDKTFADPVIKYLLKRCEEDSGLSEDVMQEHKTWQKCFDYIYAQARKSAKGNSCAVRDDVVYEWAEDYYHKNDKAEEEKKAKEAAERKKKADERRKKDAEKKKQESKDKSSAEKKKDIPKKPAPTNPKKNSKEIEGQMDFFSMMGM